MRQQDFVRLVGQSVVAHRLRSTLTALGIGIGVTAVVLLTSIGEGLNTYMVELFTQFGTTTIQIQPGKTSTFGFSPGVLNSVRPLSLDDAEALARAPHVLASVPVVAGTASVEGRGRERARAAVLPFVRLGDRACRVDDREDLARGAGEAEVGRDRHAAAGHLYDQLHAIGVLDRAPRGCRADRHVYGDRRRRPARRLS